MLDMSTTNSIQTQYNIRGLRFSVIGLRLKRFEPIRYD
jgi:hypothetical protein